MPFTPFHFGFGALAKSIAPGRFSFTTFAVAQVLMDIEPGYKMLTGTGTTLHNITHNLAGALVLALVTILLMRLFYTGKRWIPQRYWPGQVSVVVLAVSALVGTLSHVFLDGMYHADMHMPQFGWADRLDIASLSGTEVLCLLLLAAAGLIFGIRYLLACYVRPSV